MIVAGLVVIAETNTTYMAPNEARKFTQTSHKLALTSRGTLLVEAWLSGNERDYRELISTASPGVVNSSAKPGVVVPS